MSADERSGQGAPESDDPPWADGNGGGGADGGAGEAGADPDDPPWAEDDEGGDETDASGQPSSSVELYLLRHADAGDSAAWDGPDEDRPLTKKGRQQSERMGDFLKDIGFRPDALLSSPKLRAHETAKLVSREVGRKVQLDKSLAESFGLSALEALLERHGAQRVMLVGHDPDFSTLVALLCGASRVPLKKGALARIDATRPVRPGSGELRWLVPPALIRKL